MLKVLNVALTEVSYHEEAVNINKFAAYLDSLDNFYNGKKNGYAWCDIFVDYCFVKAYGRETAQKLLCQPNGSAGAGCTYSARYYRQAGRWSNTPVVGAQIFFGNATNSYHTGLVYDVDTTKVYTVEGNTADSVAKREYLRTDSSIYGYGVPDYSILSEADIASAEPIGQATCSVVVPQLTKGDAGNAVWAMQVLLINKHFSCGGTGSDGDFGAATLQGLKNFQGENGLTVDGICGALTWRKLIGG